MRNNIMFYKIRLKKKICFRSSYCLFRNPQNIEYPRYIAINLKPDSDIHCSSWNSYILVSSNQRHIRNRTYVSLALHNQFVYTVLILQRNNNIRFDIIALSSSSGCAMTRSVVSGVVLLMSKYTDKRAVIAIATNLMSLFLSGAVCVSVYRYVTTVRLKRERISKLIKSWMDLLP